MISDSKSALKAIESVVESPIVILPPRTMLPSILAFPLNNKLEPVISPVVILFPTKCPRTWAEEETTFSASNLVLIEVFKFPLKLEIRVSTEEEYEVNPVTSPNVICSEPVTTPSTSNLV